MLRQQTEEEKWLWKTLSGAGLKQVGVQTVGISEQICLIELVLKRDYRNMIRWRFSVTLVIFLTASWLLLSSILPIKEPITLGLFLEMFFLFACVPTPFLFPILTTPPSTRWIKGSLALIELSKYAPPEDSIRPLLSIARMESSYFYLVRYKFVPEIFERLAQVLARVTDFTPDNEEHQLLQRIVLNPRRYPEPLRIAALLTLGDQPERLDEKFRAKLNARLKKERGEAFQAAAQDILSRERSFMGRSE